MKRSNWKLLAGGCILLGLLGCDRSTSGLPPAQVRRDADPSGVIVETPNRDVLVNTGPGGVDVDVNRNRPAGGKKVDVDVRPGGGVDVNVDGAAIREGIQERRAERAGD